MSTPPFGPHDRPQDVPQSPGQPGGYPPALPGPPGQPGGWGQQPPSSPAQHGYNPYGQSGGYGYGYATPGTGQLATWGIRVGASIIDSLLAMIPLMTGAIAALAISGDAEDLSDGGAVALLLGFLFYFVFAIWNRIIRQGRKGQSIGKRVVGIKIVAADTGQVIGIPKALAREVCAQFFNNFCFLNVLWPLWDEKLQTWHDKVVSDLVIKL